MDPSDIVDVPIEDEMEHSQLPSVEEARMHAHEVSATNNADEGTIRKRRMMLASILVGIALLALIIGLAVGLSGNGSGNTTPLGNIKKPVEGQPAPQPTAQQPASTPTVPLFSKREEDIISYLLENEISEWGSVRTSGTPQYRAVQFLANEDGMVMDIPDPDVSREEAFQFLERYAVSVFYYALGVTNLVSSGPTCEWFRTFHNVGGGHSTNIGVVCNGQGQVQHVFTPNLNLQGALPPELGLLVKLKTLVVPDNRDVHGTIPHALRKLTDLELLDLASNNLQGEIPSWIGELTALEYLALSDNELTGSLPTSMGNLTSLALLSLDGNDLTGHIHALESLTNLRYLYLEQNELEQNIRNTTFQNLTRLVHMDLSDNKFHGDSGIPRHFFEMPILEVMDLTNNNIKGKLPENIPSNKDLRFLFLHGNSLSGSIPSSIQNLLALNHLDFAMNSFTGTLPRGLGDLSSLVYLFLAVNDFDAEPIPEFLLKLTNLRDLSLKDTQRTGSIPTWIGGLTHLILLDLDRNSLNGSIPTEIGNIEKLAFLLLNRNELTGTLPDILGSMSELSKWNLLHEVARQKKVMLKYSHSHNLAHFLALLAAMLLVENNTITGEPVAICQGGNSVMEFVADCGGDSPEVDCPLECCTTCCSDDMVCNDEALLATFDPVWERSYTRRNYYDFGGNVSFTA